MHSIDKIGPRIRSLREARGYSQEYMADMLHITQPSYAHIESGKTSMKVDRLFRIAEILHVNVIDLLEEHQIYEACSVALIVGGSIFIPHMRRAAEYWEELEKSNR